MMQPELAQPARKPRQGGHILRYVIYLSGLILAVYALYQILFMVRLTAGISRERPGPEHLVTVEIVNASGTAQNSALAKSKLAGHANKNVELVIVNSERLEYKNIERSLVISRSADREWAECVAKMIGLGESEVVYRPAYERDLSAMVTLVLGEDIGEVLNPEKPAKES